MNQNSDGAVPVGELEYVGFWLRVFAACIDTIIVVAIVSVVGSFFLHSTNTLDDMMSADMLSFKSAHFALAMTPTWSQLVLQEFLPAFLIVIVWRYRSATPGKMVIRARIVDANTGLTPSTGQLVIRYLGYYLSIFPLCLGLMWVGWDSRKQGWHDKIARTVVVRSKEPPVRHVSFPGQT